MHKANWKWSFSTCFLQALRRIVASNWDRKCIWIHQSLPYLLRHGSGSKTKEFIHDLVGFFCFSQSQSLPLSLSSSLILYFDFHFHSPRFVFLFSSKKYSWSCNFTEYIYEIDKQRHITHIISISASLWGKRKAICWLIDTFFTLAMRKSVWYVCRSLCRREPSHFLRVSWNARMLRLHSSGFLIKSGFESLCQGTTRRNKSMVGILGHTAHVVNNSLMLWDIT